MSKRIFISHAVKDKTLADSICDLFATSMSINVEEDVFCSSLEGLGIPSGKNFVQYIRNQLEGTKVIILLLTKNYFDSHFCMAELGASWMIADSTTSEASDPHVIPLVVPPVERRELDSVLTAIQAKKILEQEDWTEISDELKATLQLNFTNSTWARKSKPAIANLKKIVKKTKYELPVSHSEYSKLKKQLEESEQEVDEFEAKIEQQDQLIKELSELKDKEEVSQLLLKDSSEYDQVCNLGNKISHLINDLPCIMSDAFFYNNKGEEIPTPLPGWSNTDEKYADIKEAVDRRLLSEESFEVNKEHPKIAPILNQIKELESLLSEYEDSLRPILEDEFKCTYSLADSEFYYSIIKH